MNNKKIIQKTIDPDNEYAVFNRFLAAFLVLCGVRMTNVAPDKKNFKHDVFFFKRGGKLKKGMSLYELHKGNIRELIEKINDTLVDMKGDENV